MCSIIIPSPTSTASTWELQGCARSAEILLSSRGVLVLLVSVQILVRLDCFSHSITIEV